MAEKNVGIVRAADEYFAKIAMGKESALAICAMEKRP
jgi:hypothetical protein